MSNYIYLKGGTLIDGNGGEPISNPGVLIGKGVILALGQEAESILGQGEIRKNTTELDVTGKYVMPGLIDGHCHISSSQGAVPGMRFTDSQEYATLWTARAVGQVLGAGVTSVSVPGGKWFVDVTIRDAINAGLLEGPRIYCAGMPVGPIGNIFDSTHPATGRVTAEGVSAICDSVDDYRREIRLQAKRGVDMIKIADSYWGDKQTISAPDLASIVDEAHRLNCTVSIHARGSGSTRAAALAGMDWIFHADWATDDDLDAVAQADIPIMPCFTQCHVISTTEGIPGVGKATRDRVARQLDVAYGVIRKARERGIKLLMGTDSGNTACYQQGKYHGIEGELMVKNIGMTPMEAIVAFTKENALVMGLAGKLGTIEKDRLADVIVWDADPVKDISVLYKPELLHTVIKDGRLMKRDPIGFRPLASEPGKANVTVQG
ncbi:imidazolonepropionase [Achromobacter xylosoxidans]|uniref:amidohydrolase family protein n=1 Tax=Alcaligenes xylosoxydans xylosoxydans TaxID=85698 RepID=UPI0012A917DA|nr:amidohydrolase family protein [Achromobacter xylosoxidans]CUR72886.1 imidazolonepropionase [Achromobacter xylosoxidans]